MVKKKFNFYIMYLSSLDFKNFYNNLYHFHNLSHILYAKNIFDLNCDLNLKKDLCPNERSVLRKFFKIKFRKFLYKFHKSKPLIKIFFFKKFFLHLNLKNINTISIVYC